MKKTLSLILALVMALALVLTGCAKNDPDPPSAPPSVSLDSIPEFDGTPYVTVNGNVPFFTDEDTSRSYESFSELDSLGRCGVAVACIGIDLMPTEERGDIGHVKPSGWHSVQYDVVPGKNLYNRCHLIGFQLTGENDNEKNLITGTRNMNNEGMLPFENMIADYVKDTGNHVLYRVTPIYEGNELVARGVLMEAASVEDDEISFCIYVYNAQPGVVINYKTGESYLADDPLAPYISENHEEVEILPAVATDAIIALYAEYEDDEYSGCLAIAKVDGYAGKITLAIDISEDSKVLSVEVISHSETLWSNDIESFIDGLVGEDSSTVGEVDLVSGATFTSSGIKVAVTDALLAVESYSDRVENGKVFVINVSSGKFHEETCSGAISMSDKNKLVFVGFYEDLVDAGYSPCGTCDPEDY